ncbi:MAG: carboxypeptidase-like regulatory domain-containing protein, partial [FCB group bacterium]
MKTKFTFLIVILLLLAGTLGVQTLSAQMKTISGKVSLEKGNPLAGVTVTAKATTIGTFTKADGTYKITVPNNVKALIFRMVGMKQK